ncbi:hypothetical protein EYC98_10315 [Halieaceae bacterium IMCC14734]|uniref:Heme-copper oxidase subunit III family profile domain-containing protein n=1 Tax=Candidatus Litorirhabdus singularis TaxID=2518993 RepID=A0ABT3THN9_9GAMM|nr:cytochrome c oxidase subunit 3 [Candidatus Litorirhabdus singularis]MCX2981256.1 hypothetical protein [Candidatus Litorirhabdus singularis]
MTTLIKTLAEKPWLSGHDGVGVPAEVAIFDLAKEKVGLRAFFAVAASLFMLFVVAYRLRMVYSDWVPVQDPGVLWLSTGLLVVASVALQVSSIFMSRQHDQRALTAFYVGGVCTLLFVCCQLVAWSELSNAGYLVSTNPASSFFYLLTAVHGLHVIGGLVAWLRTAIRMRSAEPGAARIAVDLCTLYSHFLLLVWAGLFYLLLNS